LRYKALVDFLPYPLILFNLDGTVDYVNPAFTEVFGWTLDELKGHKIPYVPPGLEEETREKIKQLKEKKAILRHETKRLTKDGRVLDVVMRGAIVGEDPQNPFGQLVTLRDITQEKRLQRTNEILLKISLALPEYPDLEDLLDFVGEQVKELTNSEGALIILMDFDRQELYTIAAAYEDRATEKRVKEIRFKINELIAGEVIMSGEPKIINEIKENVELHRKRDEKLGYKTRNLLVVPMKSVDRTVGALCAINKKSSYFDETDLNMLTMIANTVVLSIENARFSDELKKAFIEVSKMNRAKDKLINHLSHELKTPVSVLMGSLKVLESRLKKVPEEVWLRTIQRAIRNTDRIVDLVDRIEDIVTGKRHPIRSTLNEMLTLCADEIETLISELCPTDRGLEKIRDRIEEIYGLRSEYPKKVDPALLLNRLFPQLRKESEHRDIKTQILLQRTCTIRIPEEVFLKAVRSLYKNAVENTPDGGLVKVEIALNGDKCLLKVEDTGVGIPLEYQDRIFDGFVTTRDTLLYSTKRPFDFNAGGKGMDLLRLKVFSERFGFRIS
ncbi:MAG: PAS domain S-box protein, partial [Desulfatiglandales bacterium]